MNYFTDIYLKRLNRFGLDYQTRIQNKRELEFEHYLLKSTYRVHFKFEGHVHPGSLERDKQTDSEVFQYLLVRRTLKMPPGTILEIYNDDTNEMQRWMVYVLEDIEASGYNRYIMLKMTYFIEWDNGNSWVYFKGPKLSPKKDTIKSKNNYAIYLEDFNSYLLVMPRTPKIQKDTYFTIGEGELRLAFRVTGFDILTIDGVEFVTLDPIYIRDEHPAPEKTPEDSAKEFYWLTGEDDG